MVVCYYHVTYTLKSESALCNCLNVKELLTRNWCDIFNCNGIQCIPLMHEFPLHSLKQLVLMKIYEIEILNKCTVLIPRMNVLLSHTKKLLKPHLRRHFRIPLTTSYLK